MGTYKYLIIYFCIFSIFFSILEAIVNPFILSVGSVFVVVMNLSKTIITNRSICQVLVNMICGCFGVVISLIAVHFIFRYFAIQREGKLKYFRGKYMVIWFFIPIMCGIFWTSTTYYFLKPNDRVTLILKDHLKLVYDVDTENIVYTGSDYFIDDLKYQFNFEIIPGMIIMATIIIISLSIVALFWIKIYKAIKKLDQQGQSDFTRKLQKQLFYALVIQSCIPLFFMYLPVSLFLFLPVFNIQIDKMGHIVTLLYAIYPSIDPLPVILIIDCYRLSLFNLFRKNNRVGELNDIPSGRDNTF
ncbi:unnamed protein product [Caenorhabditis angaria]|uniref:Serpentine receptor class r-10 n=1 Tax=Caenorhabditis angaria TaxID=860376 RepID=A0A9P1IU06_9PELO|nr:unnamed protein product [Caenorhabditis angaria]